MNKYKVLYCDLDGTLIRTISGNTFPKGVWDMKFRFDVLDAIKKLKPEYVFIVTNQGGIERGHVNVYSFEEKLKYVERAVTDYIKHDGLEYVSSKYCPLNDPSYKNRKPNTGMLKSCMDDVKYIQESCLMIGDASGKEG